MDKKISPPDKTFQIRCPKLGHQVYFAYCRLENQGFPCIRTLDCWYRYFEVEAYLREELSEEEWQNAFERMAQPKMLSLVEMIEAAQKRAKKS